MEKKLKSDEKQERVYSAFYCLAVSRSRLLSSLRCYYLQLLLRVCVCVHRRADVSKRCSKCGKRKFERLCLRICMFMCA